jgi:TP901 family phage tail tape measure protein
VGELNARLGLDSSGFTSGLTSAEGLASHKGLAIGAALAAGGVAAMSAWVDFDKGIREVFTLLPGASEQTRQALVDDVKAFATEAGRTTGEVLPALYQALSAGVPAANVFDFLQVANEAAVGGVTDLETAVDGLSSVVNAYGAETLPARAASDLFFTTVRLGKTTMGELSDAMFQVAPIAAALGVDFVDVSAALAAITLKGTPTSVAATQIRGALAELGKEGTQAADIFQRITGQSFPAFMAGGGTLEGALQALSGYADANNLSMVDLFGSIEAGQAAMALTGQGAEAFRGILGQMGEASGATAGAFEEMDQGMSRSMDRIKAKLSVLAVDLGQSLAPAAAGAIDVLGQLGGLLGDVLGPVMAALQPIIGAVTAVLGSLTGGVGMAIAAGLAATALFNYDLAGALSNLKTKLAGAGEGVSGLLGKLSSLHPATVGIGLAVTAAVGVFMAWSNAKKEAAERAQAFADTLDAETGAVTDNTTALLQNDLQSKGLLDDLNAMGISMDTYTAAVSGNEEALTAVTGAMQRARDEGTLGRGEAFELAKALTQQAVAAGTAAEQHAELDRQQQIQREEAARLGDQEQLLEQFQRGQARATEEAGDATEDATEAYEAHEVQVTDLAAAERALAEQRQDALNPLRQLRRAEDELATAQAEVTRLQTAGETSGREYEDALLDLAIAQADLDVISGQVKGTTRQTAEAFIRAGRDAGIADADLRRMLESMGLMDEAGWNLGEAIRSGVLQGLAGLGLRFGAAVVSEIESGMVHVQGRFLIASPSRWMAEHLGRPLAEGVALGFTTHGPVISTAMQNAVAQALTHYQQTGLPEALSMAAVQLGAPIPEAVAEAIRSGRTSVSAALSQLVGDALAQVQAGLGAITSAAGAALASTNAQTNLLQLKAERHSLVTERSQLAIEREANAAARQELEARQARADELRGRIAGGQYADPAEKDRLEAELAQVRLTSEEMDELRALRDRYQEMGERLEEISARLAALPDLILQASIAVIEAALREQQAAAALTGGMTEQEWLDYARQLGLGSADAGNIWRRAHGMARGGITRHPTTRLIGEAGAEAVIPLTAQGLTPLIQALRGPLTDALVYAAGGRPSAPAGGEHTQPLVIQLRGDVTLDGYRVAELVMREAYTQMQQRTGWTGR